MQSVWRWRQNAVCSRVYCRTTRQALFVSPARTAVSRSQHIAPVRLTSLVELSALQRGQLARNHSAPSSLARASVWSNP